MAKVSSAKSMLSFPPPIKTKRTRLTLPADHVCGLGRLPTSCRQRLLCSPMILESFSQFSSCRDSAFCFSRSSRYNFAKLDSSDSETWKKTNYYCAFSLVALATRSAGQGKYWGVQTNMKELQFKIGDDLVSLSIHPSWWQNPSITESPWAPFSYLLP